MPRERRIARGHEIVASENDASVVEHYGGASRSVTAEMYGARTSGRIERLPVVRRMYVNRHVVGAQSRCESRVVDMGVRDDNRANVFPADVRGRDPRTMQPKRGFTMGFPASHPG
jgi:hypothetical protein